MPEVLTSNPEKVVNILEKGGEAECGETVTQQILTDCPQQRFCQVEWVENGVDWIGEICAYGINEIGNMSQITEAELSAVISKSGLIGTWTIDQIIVIFMVLFIGILAGYLIKGSINYFFFIFSSYLL